MTNEAFQNKNVQYIQFIYFTIVSKRYWLFKQVSILFNGAFQNFISGMSFLAKAKISS